VGVIIVRKSTDLLFCCQKTKISSYKWCI